MSEQRPAGEPAIAQEDLSNLLINMTRNTRRATRAAFLITLVLCVGALLWLGFSFYQVVRLGEQKTQLAAEVQLLEKQSDSLVDVRNALLKELGYSPERVQTRAIDDHAIAQTLKAGEARRNIVEKSDAHTRENITIQLFSRSVDRGVIAGELKGLGFEVVAKEPNRLIPAEVRTNGVFYGPQVTCDEVKLVALTLLRAGVELKVIEPFADPRGRNRIVQVGSKNPPPRDHPITAEEINSLTCRAGNRSVAVAGN
ncbi:MAG TPA: hypothetical protein VFO52_15290 [Longimicrobiales bacterium]|nr:hypothetical protein [Longimicrobiales bacterium]